MYLTSTIIYTRVPARALSVCTSLILLTLYGLGVAGFTHAKYIHLYTHTHIRDFHNILKLPIYRRPLKISPSEIQP